MDIIMFAIGRWDQRYSSTYWSLAKEFAKDHRVFYIDNPITLKYFISRYKTPEIQKRKSALIRRKNTYTDVILSDKGRLTAITPPLTLPINFIPAGSPFYQGLAWLNDRLLWGMLRKLLRDFDIKEFILFNAFNPFYLQHLPKDFKPKVNIYMSVDDISQSVHIRKHGPALERKAVEKADLTLVTSRELRSIQSKYSKNVFLLPNAADVALFQTAYTQEFDRPKEIEGIDKPIVLFMGHIEHRTDFGLLKALLEGNRDKVFLMVGPWSIDAELLNKLREHPNILFTGGKKLEELPAYLQYSQCAIIPFKHNQLTRSIYPLKVNEYLAAGKPVVSTSFSEDIRDFASVISVADTPEKFTEAINEAIKTDSREKAEARIRFVADNNWQNRAERFWNILKIKN